ncbi:MAG: hypothetical protein WCX96_00435, partial [Bacilli bacterium]
MELIDLYNQIQNPLNDSIIEMLVQAYSDSKNSGDLYNKLIETEIKQYTRQYYESDSDIFYSMMFNQWKKNVVEMTRERFIDLRQKGKFGSDFIKMREYLKTVPDVSTRKEMLNILYGNNDSEVSEALDKYNWKSLGEGSGWIHVCSRYVTAKKDEYPRVEHRLYLNTESVDIHRIVTYLVKKCDNYHLPYYFKFDEYADRSDTVVIYSDSKNLINYINILKEIKQEYPDLIAKCKRPPILTGKIDGWIGYGSEPGRTPDGRPQSFSTVRAKAIENAIKEATYTWINNNRNRIIQYQNQKMTFQDYISMKATENMLSEMERRFNLEAKYESKEEVAKKKGYTLPDIQSENYKQAIYNIIKNQMSQCLNQMLSGNEMNSIEMRVRYGKTIAFTKYDLSKTIEGISINIFRNDKEFVSDVKSEIIKKSKQSGIDTDKYCFDMAAKDKIKAISANNENDTVIQNISTKTLSDPNLYPQHDFSFGGLKKTFTDYDLQKDGEGKLVAFNKKMNINYIDPLTIARAKFAKAWFEANISSRSISGPSLDGNDKNAVEKYIFDDGAKETYDIIKASIQQQLLKTGNVDVLEVLENVKLASYSGANSIAENLFSKSHFAKATVDWVRRATPNALPQIEPILTVEEARMAANQQTGD